MDVHCCISCFHDNSGQSGFLLGDRVREMRSTVSSREASKSQRIRKVCYLYRVKERGIIRL